MPADHELIDALLAGHTDRHDEEVILALLRGASGPDLDRVLRTVDTAALFGSVDDHWFGPQHRTALRALVVARVDELSLEAQAAVVHGLQVGRTDRADEDAIAAVLLARSGEELTRLKNLINSRNDNHDLEGLVFDEIGDAGVRERILAHIAEQAAGVQTGETKILCDIDDTVLCSLHDRRYPRGVVYPGILALLEALDHGPGAEPFSTGDLTFVTARPGDVLGLIENHTRSSLRRAGVSTHSVLTGTLTTLFTHDLMAGEKLANIDHYRQLFPEYRKVYLGDSGQGDIRVGEILLERFGDVVDLVVIHDVVGTPADERERLASAGIHLVDTWIGAARIARERGLISEAGLERVVTSAFAGLDALAWASDEQREAALERHRADAVCISMQHNPACE